MMHGQERLSLSHSEKMRDVDPQIQRNFDHVQNRWNQSPTYATWEWITDTANDTFDLTTGSGSEKPLLKGLYPNKADSSSGPEGCVDFVKEHSWTELEFWAGGEIDMYFATGYIPLQPKVYISKPGKWDLATAAEVKAAHPYDYNLRPRATYQPWRDSATGDFYGQAHVEHKLRVRELPWSLYYGAGSWLYGYMDPGTEGIPAGRYRVYPVWQQMVANPAKSYTADSNYAWLEIREVPPRVPPFDR
jgi:hypothetical protein